MTNRYLEKIASAKSRDFMIRTWGSAEVVAKDKVLREKANKDKKKQLK
jgi:hypothetical protein